MNSRKAILYISIMLFIPFFVAYLITNSLPDSSDSLKISFLGTLYISGQIFVLGLMAEGVQYLRGKYKENEKVFWHEWVETTFAIWILAAIIVSIIQIYIRIK